MADWTTRGVFSVLVLIAGLGFGREVVQWWRSETPPAIEENPFLATDALGDPREVHDLQFGDLPWQFTRQSFDGSREAAVAILRDNCRQRALADPPPGELPGQAEENLLARLRRCQAAEEKPGKWQLYQLPGDLPMVAVIREPQVAQEARRVVTWGLAVPMGQQRWALYTLAATGPTNDSSAGLPELPLPPDSRRVLSLRVAGGGTMMSFQGDAPPERWQHFFDDWFQQHEWTGDEQWTSSGTAWHRRYTSAAQEASRAVEIHLRRNRLGKLIGIMSVHEAKRPSEPAPSSGSGRVGPAPGGTPRL